MIELTFLKELKSTSKECDICHYCCFLDKGFKFQPDVYSGCHDVLMMPMNLSDIAILNIKGADCRCIISGFSKIEEIWRRCRYYVDYEDVDKEDADTEKVLVYNKISSAKKNNK